MNRNTEMHFSELPTLEISRSKFDMSHTHITTANASELVPCYVDCDIVPGDTVTMRQSEIVRMMTPIAPVMDNCFMDFYWFFIPNRLVMDDWKKLMGENETAPWTQTQDVQIPQLRIKNTDMNQGQFINTVLKGSVLDHMGIPISNFTTTSDGKEINISSLPTKAYCLVWNEYFRDENLQNPLYIPKTSGDRLVVNKNHQSYIATPDTITTQYEFTGGLPCMKVCKTHDYFTSCLPGPLKGEPVKVPMAAGITPIQTAQYHEGSTSADPGYWITTGNTAFHELGTSTAPKTAWGTFGDPEETDPMPSAPDVDFNYGGWDYNSLVIDFSQVAGTTIQQLRQAFAIQKFYERDARGGTRYIESIWAHFRVRNPDYRMQRPEYLGGFRQNINMNQVIQNSPTVQDSTPLGTTGAYSVTTHQDNDVFSHSFTEHGILLGLFCIRQEHTYCQGINRMWFKKKRLDFYSPEFANLSEQAVLEREIYVTGDKTADESAFGYQEAWAEMRYKPNICSAEMSLVNSDSLGATWTYADKYTEAPSLGDKWIKETDVNINRTLAVQNHDQFMLDFYFAPIYTRPLPLYSVPGLIDHH